MKHGHDNKDIVIYSDSNKKYIQKPGQVGGHEHEATLVEKFETIVV